MKRIWIVYTSGRAAWNKGYGEPIQAFRNLDGASAFIGRRFGLAQRPHWREDEGAWMVELPEYEIDVLVRDIEVAA